MPLTYEKKIYPVSWERPYTPPTPPTPTTITVSFDSSSQYIAGSIPSITLNAEDTNTLMTTSSSGTDSELGIYVNGTKQYTVIPNFVDEFCFVARWENDESNVFLPGVEYPIASDLLAVPIVTHQVIHKDTQGPCPNGYHIATIDEWNIHGIKETMENLGVWNKTDFINYFKIPTAYYLNRKDGSKNTSYGPVRRWTSTMTSKNVSWCVGVDEKNSLIRSEDKPGNGFSIRPFKDKPVLPDNTWTVLKQGTDTAGIYWNATLGLISFSANGTKWYTMMDKNLGATNVGDDGLYYQFGNNYGFNVSPASQSGIKVNTTGYGPGNYYNSSTFVTVSGKATNWMSVDNNNIWGGVTNGTWTDPV